jgi:chromosome segregation ATPase
MRNQLLAARLDNSYLKRNFGALEQSCNQASSHFQQLRIGWLEELDAHKSSREKLDELKVRMRNAWTSLTSAQNAISPVRQNLEEEKAEAEQILFEVDTVDDGSARNSNFNQYSRLQSEFDILQDSYFRVLKVLDDVEGIVSRAKHHLRLSNICRDIGPSLGCGPS